MSEVHPVILFYKYVPIEDPPALVKAQRQLCSRWNLKGRILIAEEGINGTLAGPAPQVDAYVHSLRRDKRFSDIEIKVSPGTDDTFPKLVVKVRKEIVTLDCPQPLLPDHDNHVTPAEWKRLIEKDPDAVLLDVRNEYESAAGKFEGAVTCAIENFRELPDYIEKLGHLRDRKVLMYCTGGIRCEKASALFRSRGFRDIRQLHGGIMTYQKEFGNEHWLGECFVFDNRMTIRVEENLVQIGRCVHSGRESTRYVNCLHDPCHRLFILDEEAERENPDYRLCPQCLAAGLTRATAGYKRTLGRISELEMEA